MRRDRGGARSAIAGGAIGPGPNRSRCIAAHDQAARPASKLVPQECYRRRPLPKVSAHTLGPVWVRHARKMRSIRLPTIIGGVFSLLARRDPM